MGALVIAGDQMGNLTRKLEVGANVAIIIVALLLGAVLVKRFLLSPAPQAPHEIAAGTKVDLPGVDWHRDGKTLVLVLQKGCHFCAESAPFYQRLVREASGRPVQLVAVLPQGTEEAKAYLSELNVSVPTVMQASLRTLGVSGTPTLILVDDRGAVIKSWVGKLPAEQEAEVLNKVRS
jgi:hypothetical protein